MDLVGSVTIVVVMVIFAHFAIVYMEGMFIDLSSPIDISLLSILRTTKSGGLKLIIGLTLHTFLFVLHPRNTGILIVGAPPT